MSLYKEANNLVKDVKNIVVLQADNPDGDSLGTSLALEAIFSEMGKTVHMICSVDMPSYLRYLSGWDRVEKEIPQNIDLTIIVDNSTESLFENYEKNPNFSWIKSKPIIVIDHHIESSGISYSTLNIVETAVATSEIIHKMAIKLDWPLPLDACEPMATSIMSDSVGLVSDATSPDSFRVIADLVERGVSLAKLDQKRRKLMQRHPMLLPFKGDLLKRVELDCDGQLAGVLVKWQEIEKYSPLYNPTMLVMDDMRITEGVKLAIGYKLYRDGKITAKIRCNYGSPIGAELAAEFGGGGHPYASGFKITDGTSLENLKSKVNQKVTELLDKIEEEK